MDALGVSNCPNPPFDLLHTNHHLPKNVYLLQVIYRFIIQSSHLYLVESNYMIHLFDN